MPLSAKKVAASYSGGGVRIPRAPLVSCLTCPLCSNLFREATTISECLHTFCRECIHSRLSDGETNSCPMCNVSLGTLPLEKLRADHQLEDVKVKLFPDVARKRKNGPGTSPVLSSVPMRRKERSLYSLGIGAQPSLANPGLATRSTRGSSGKSVAGRDSSSSGDEEEDMDDDEEQTDEESPERQGAIPSRLPQSASPPTTINTRVSDFGVELSSDDEIVPRRPSRAKEEPRRAPIRDTAPIASSDLGLYLAHRSVLTGNGFSRTRSGSVAEALASLDELQGVRVKTTQEERTTNADNRSATMGEGSDPSAEVSRAVTWNQAEQPQPTPLRQLNASPDLTRIRDVNNDANQMVTRPSAITQALENIALRASPPRARRSSPQLQRNPSLRLFVNGGVERPAILKHPTQPPPNGSHLASTSLPQSSCGIWFALQAARNQSDNPLPQLSSPYLRIKDGKLPVSHVKKYLVKKLGLSNETEVEITCRGQPVVSSLPLESVRNIWFATAAVPNLKDQEDQSQTAANESSTGLMHLDTSSAKELIMVLTYQRHRRNSRIC